MAEILDSLYVQGKVSSSTQGFLVGSYDEMPEPAEDRKGAIVYYHGPVGDFIPHTFYICRTVNDGRTWEWHPLVLALDKTRELALHAVPKSTTVNGYPLDGDITLSAEDVGAMPNTVRIPTKVSDLSNDGVFITQDVCTLANYWTKEQTDRLMSTYCKIVILDDYPEDDAIEPTCLYSIPVDGVRKLFYRVEGQWVPVA